MLKEEDYALIWFDYNGYNFSKVEQILHKFVRIDSIFNKTIVKSTNLSSIDKDLKTKLLDIDYEEFINKIDREFFEYGITAVTYVDEEYPNKLRHIADPPLVLYTKGDITLLSKKSISIVGTRKPTDYGKIVCEKFTKELSEAGLVTISGLAYGIDTIVATATLNAGGKTIAVLAGGLDSIYPSQNKGLADKLVSSGSLLVSEYRPKIAPVNYAFINRNRIVSALGAGTLIIEAGKSSGTMSTARHALEQGRELFVVPGNITSEQSMGTNMLIDEIPDTFTISPARILMRLNVKRMKKTKTTIQVDLTESQILDALKTPLSFDELSDVTGIKASELSSRLIKMEVIGLVKKGNGNVYHKL